MVPRWIATVAGRVDPQGFADVTPLHVYFVYTDVTADTSLKMKNTVDTIIGMLGAPRNYGMSNSFRASYTFCIIVGRLTS